MKLEDIFDEQGLNIPVSVIINEAIKQLPGNEKGGFIRSAIKGAKDLMVKHPVLTVAAGIYAIDAYQKYKKNKRNTITFHATDPYERKMITSIVDTLTTQGRFRIHKTKLEHGGKTWILKKL